MQNSSTHEACMNIRMYQLICMLVCMTVRKYARIYTCMCASIHKEIVCCSDFTQADSLVIFQRITHIAHIHNNKQVVELGRKMGLNWSRRAARDIITATDVNRDGQVSMDELWRWLKLIEVIMHVFMYVFVWMCVSE